MARSIGRCGLRGGEHLNLLDYRGEDTGVPIKPLHRMTQARARRETAAVELVWEQTLDVLPTQQLMVVRKP